MTVKFDEDGCVKVVSDSKHWKLRSMDDDDGEVNFETVQEGDKVYAYWSPNRAYYQATVTSTSSCGRADL